MNAHSKKLHTDAENGLFEYLDKYIKTGEEKRSADWLKSNGLPHRRIEDWKYTDLRALLKSFPTDSADDAEIEASDQGVPADVWLEVINHQIEAEPENPPAGVTIAAGPSSLDAGFGNDIFHAGDNANLAINRAIATVGYDITVSATDKTPSIYLDHKVMGEKAITASGRHNIVVEEGASALLIESFTGDHDLAYLQTAGVTAHIKKGGKLTHIRIIDEGNASTHLGVIGAVLEADAVYAPFVLTLGSYLVRTDMHVTLAGERGHGAMRGATLVRRKEHVDMTLAVKHVAPNCTSVEEFRSVIEDKAKSVFQGKIMVEQLAQKTDAKMMSQALLLTDNGEFLNKPELEIFADDVVCGHGATCGTLNEDLLFYLLSRGISRDEAEMLMVRAFVAETIEATEEPEMIELLEDLLKAWLKRRRD